MLELLIMLAELPFEFIQLLGQIFLHRQDFSQPDKCANELDAGANGDWAIQHVRRHHGPVFRKCQWKFAPTSPPGT
jgi:hypothetical protein